MTEEQPDVTCNAVQPAFTDDADIKERQLFERIPDWNRYKYFCRVCNGAEDGFTVEHTMRDRIRLHARRHPGCKWLIANKGEKFILEELCEVGVRTPEQICNTSAGHIYDGDLTQILGSYPMYMCSPTNPKTCQSRPVVPAGRRRDDRWPRYPKYTIVDHRKATFIRYPSRDMGISADQLAQAGFCYFGQDDKVRCFWCGGGLEGLTARGITADNIIKFHIWSYYGCPYMALAYGARFVLDTFRRAPLNMRSQARQSFAAWRADPDCSELVYQEEIVKFIDDNLEAEMSPGYRPPPTPDLGLMRCRVTDCHTKVVYAMGCSCLVCDNHLNDSMCQVCKRRIEDDDGTKPWATAIMFAE